MTGTANSPHPLALQALIEQVRDAAARRAPLVIRGGGTKAFYGRPLRGEPLDLRPLGGVVQYEPSELVVTVQAGTPLAELESVLHGRGQRLAFEPPRFATGGHVSGTVGGMVAAGLAGPARPRAGGVRDHVLGLSMVDGRGRLLHFGGTVMKNVAGYDVSRALAGSLGTLGVITEVSLKVLPLPAAQATLAFDLAWPEAHALLQRWAAEPWPIEASAWHAGQLTVRLAGAAAAVNDAAHQLGGSVLADGLATGHWRSLRNQTAPFFAPTGSLWRLALPATAPMPALAGAWLVEWHGAQRWLRSDAEPATVRAAAAALGGHATWWQGPADREVFTRPAPAPMAIQQRLKDSFDPLRLFNRGRLYPDL